VKIVGEEKRLDNDDASSGDDTKDEGGPLVDRLRRLEWPTVDADFRQRSWEQFKQLIGESEKKPEHEPDDESGH
jgi:hypothetical protein